MCLHVKNVNKRFNKKLKHKPYVKVSDEDIKVWKRFKRFYLPKLNLSTPFRKKQVSPDGDIMTACGFSSRWSFFNELEIHRGIHAYTNQNYARRFRCYNEIILECVIPAGTPYIKGTECEICTLQLIVPPIN